LRNGLSRRANETWHPDLDVREGNCYDNAVVETVFKSLNSEMVWRVFQTRAEAGAAIGRHIDAFYNPVRRCSTLAYVSPVQFERLAG
jgi:putative transposase